jgi:hypothetical protein
LRGGWEGRRDVMTRPAFATPGTGAWSRVRPNRTHQWRPHSQLVNSPVFSRLDQLVDSISGVPAWPSFAYISWVTGSFVIIELYQAVAILSSRVLPCHSGAALIRLRYAAVV